MIDIKNAQRKLDEMEIENRLINEYEKWYLLIFESSHCISKLADDDRLI